MLPNTEWGLSPLARGYLRVHGHLAHLPGSTPVRTGLPPAPVWQSAKCGVYPRSHRATFKIVDITNTVTGLSPFAWGYPFVHLFSRLVGGSIPVCTGLPKRPRRRASSSQVYPRSRGATRVTRGRPICSRGLSPFTRGYRRDNAHRLSDGGSIPSHGATMNSSVSFAKASGLSPFARGYPASVGSWGAAPGSIPARTGLPSDPSRRPGRA